MRILMVAPQVPWPPHQGTALRNYHIAAQLARRHMVTVLAFGAPGAPTGPLADAGVRVAAVPAPPPRTTARRALDVATNGLPDLAVRLGAPEMLELAIATARAERDLGGFEVVQVEGLEMAPVGLAAFAAACGGSPEQATKAAHTLPARPGAVETATGPQPRLIYDAHNAEWLLQHRAWLTDVRHVARWHGALYSVAQTIKLRRYERALMDACDATVAVSSADADALKSLGGRHVVSVVPNGVDTESYAPPQGQGAAEPQAGLCVFVGKMDFRPNVDAMRWFCGGVWPLIRQSSPGAKLAIVGRDPAPQVAALAADDVLVTGTVDDVLPWLERAQVVVVPLRVGGGTRLKVLEAMAMAKPIAATTLAVEGLEVKDGVEVLLADQPADLATAVTRLLSDAPLRSALGEKARLRAASDYRWETLVPRIEGLYDTARAAGP